MNKMKKALLLAMSFVMSASLLAACGKNKDKDSESSSGAPVSSEAVSSSEAESSNEEASSSNEEASSSNEEASSSNEEASSSNEEVSSSDEEASSSNEEESASDGEESASDGEESASDGEDSSSEAPTVDETAPVISDVDEAQFAGLKVGDTITIPTVTATDEKDGAVEVFVSFGSPKMPMPSRMGEVVSLDMAGTYVIKYQAWDEAGNEGLKEIYITVAEDLSDMVSHWDRINKNILEDGKTEPKENKYNYWDGSESTVTVETQYDVVNGSQQATKLTFNVSKLTEEEKANVANGSWADWAFDSMWVGFAIPVGGMDLTNYELVFDMKTENMNTSLIAYAASDYEGDLDAAYATDGHTTFKQEDMEALEDGWYRWTISVACNSVGTEADYIILSLDNTASGVDKAQDSIAYIDNMSLVEVVKYSVTVDGEAQEVREGESLTLETPSKEGYDFLGWFDAEGNEVTSPVTVTKDMVITSDWKKQPIQAKLNETVDVLLTTTGDYELATFTANAGTYDVVMTGGIVAYTLADMEAENWDNPLTQIVLEEDGEYQFAIAYGEELEDRGTITIICDYTAGLEKEKLDNHTFGGSNYSWDLEQRPFVDLNGTVDTEITAPEGYETVTRFDWYKESTTGWKINSNPLYRIIYNQKNISTYDVVRFAFNFTTNDPNAYIELGDRSRGYVGQWLTVELVKAESAWMMTVFAEDGSVLYHTDAVTMVAISNETYPTIANTVFTSGWINGGTTRSQAITISSLTDKQYDACVYSTEVYAYKGEAEPYDPQISEKAVMVRTSIWRQDSNGNGYALSASTTELAPTGFTIVKEYKWNLNTTISNGVPWGSTNKDMPLTCLDEAVVSEYLDVYFAMKNVGGTGFYVQGGTNYTGTDWLYYHYHRESKNDTWSLTLRSPDGYEAVNVHTGLTGTTLQKLMAWAGTGVTTGKGCYPMKNDGDTTTDVRIYMTDMWAVAAPYEFVAPEGAVYVRDSIWRTDNYALNTSTEEAVPSGFSKVSEFDWEGNAIGYQRDSTEFGPFVLDNVDQEGYTDLSQYSDLYFALKLVNGKDFWIRGNITYTGSAWLYAHYSQAEDGTWNLSLRSADGVMNQENVQTGIVGTDFRTLMTYDSTYTHNGFYPRRNSADEAAKLYMTDVLGIAKTVAEA